MRRIMVLLGVGLMVMVFVRSGEAQIVYGQRPSVMPRFVFQSWTIKDGEGTETRLGQWAVPLYGYVPLADNLEVRIGTSVAGSDLDVGTTNRLSGVGDVKIQGAYALWNDQALVNVGINAPTGKQKLTEEETGVSVAMASDLLGLPVKRLGEGLGLTGGLALAREVGSLVVGVGANVLWHGEYEPLDDGSTYKVGSELTVTGGVDFPLSHGLVRANGVYTVYGADEQEGTALYRKGNQLDVEASLVYQGRVGFGLTVLEILRGKNEVSVEGTLEEEEENSHGNDLRVYGHVRYPLSSSWALVGTAQAKFFSANGYDEGDMLYRGSASLVGVGGSVQWTPDGSLSLDVGGRFFTGSSDDGNTDITGMEVSVGGGVRF